jgi:predicted nucleotidyltransferase
MKERWRVIKAVKPSGNSGSVYVPREWIGQSVEISLYSAEAIVLEALYPYVESILGVYIYGPHASGRGAPEQDVDVLVISEKSLGIIPGNKGIDCTVIVKDELEEYAKAYPAEYAAILSEAVPLMNDKLLEEMRSYKLDDDAEERFYDSLERSIAIARSLAKEGDHSSAAYALMQRLKDYSVLSSNGKYRYLSLEEYAVGKGLDKERFGRLFEAYEAKKHDNKPEYAVGQEDVAALLKILEEIRGKKDELDVGASISGTTGTGTELEEPVQQSSQAPVPELSREGLIEKARKYREKYGSGAI